MVQYLCRSLGWKQLLIISCSVCRLATSLTLHPGGPGEVLELECQARFLWSVISHHTTNSTVTTSSRMYDTVWSSCTAVFLVTSVVMQPGLRRMALSP